MPKYQNTRFLDDDQDLIDHEEDRNMREELPEPSTAEEKTYAKRYGDLRRHSQQQEAKLRGLIKDLEQKLESVSKDQLELPTNEADIEAWTKKYPDIAKIVMGIARKQAEGVTKGLDERVKALDDREAELRKAEAQRKLAEAHPDFFDEIREDEAFHEWLAEQDEDSQDALYNNDYDWRRAARVIATYKWENGITKEPKKPTQKRDRSDAAREVNVRGGSKPTDKKGYKFSESQIHAMKPAEYDRLEAEIEAAMREGKVLMDITGGAR